MNPLTCVRSQSLMYKGWLPTTSGSSGKQVEYAQIRRQPFQSGSQVSDTKSTTRVDRKTSRSGLLQSAVIDTKEGTMRKYDVEHAKLLLESAYIELDTVRLNMEKCEPEDLPEWIRAKNKAIQKVANLEIKLRDAENSLIAQQESEHGEG